MTAAPARILVVEDDPAVIQLLRILLERDSYEVFLASDGLTGLALAREKKPDLIVLDVLLPGLNGFEVCQRLRQDPSTCLIPVLILTSLEQTKDKVTGLKLGADEYVSKPFDALELSARVDRAIRRRREGLAANSRTDLPGAAALDEEIRRRVVSGEPFSVGRVGVAGLGDFNVSYGYDRGDHVVRLVGVILKSAVLELGDQNDLAAHLGSANFGFVSAAARAEVIAARALENAEVLLMMQYNATDRLRNRRGNSPRSWMNLRIGLADFFPRGPTHVMAIQDVAREAFKEAQGNPGAPLVRRSVGESQAPIAVGEPPFLV